MSIFKRMYQIERDISEERADQVSILLRAKGKLEKQVEDLQAQLKEEQDRSNQTLNRLIDMTDRIESYTKDGKINLKG